MKRITSLIIALAIVLSAAAGLITASAENGASCLDFIILQDEDHNQVGTLNSTLRNLGDISATIAADNVKYIRFQGWHSEDVEIVDIGYSIDEGDVIWGCSYYDAKLVGNKEATGHEYPLRYGAEVPVEEGEDILIDLWYRLDDGEEDTFGPGFRFMYTNVPTNDSFISFNRSFIKYIDGAIAPSDGVITVVDPTNEGKDWIGLFLLDGIAVEDLEVSEADYIGWKSYVTGEKMELSAANFKQEGAEDLEPGDYAIALLENDTYKILSAVAVKVVPEGGDASNFDNVSINGLASNNTIRDFGDITEFINEEHNAIRIYGWYTSDTEIECIGYRYPDGTNDTVIGINRSDASNAKLSVYGMGIDLLVPLKTGVDVSFDLFVRYADGDEYDFESFTYTYDPNGEFTPKPTAEPTPTPTPTPVPTATPEVTNTPEPTATAVPEDPTDAPTNAPTDAPAEDPTPTTAPASNGCGGIAGGFAALFTLTLAAALIAAKKKEER